MIEQRFRLLLAIILPTFTLIVLGLILTVQSVKAETYIVNTLADENDGCFVGDCSLRDAIADASDGDTINFSVSGTIDISGNGQLVVSKSVTISSSLPITVSGNNAVRVFQVITGTTPTVAMTIGGLTISHGNDTSSDCGSSSCGGGIYVGNGTSVTLTNSSLINNTADWGGGIVIDGSSGGSAHLTLNNSALIGNSANLGGGILNHGGAGSAHLTLNSSILSGNSASFGGGIYNSGSSSGSANLTLNSSRVYSNSATGVGSLGGGIYSRSDLGSASLTLNYSTVYSNSASSRGGGIYHDGALGNTSLILNYSTLYGNSALNGGGIYNNGSSGGSASLTLNNSTLFSNSAATGAGIFNFGQSGSAGLTLNNTTLSGNEATNNGGGIFNFGQYGSANLTFKNSTLSGNSAGTGGGIYNFESAMHLSNSLIANSTGADCFSSKLDPVTNINNLIEDDSCNPDISGDPMLGPLADNGGETLTHALLPDSPAIDTGDNPTCLASDQRGISRPQDGNNNGDVFCDIGAFEVESLPSSQFFIYLPSILNNDAS